jgi:hypothetical protein
VRSILNLTSTTGDTQIKRSYAELGDIYHALGACRATIIAIALSVIIYIPARHAEQFVDHIARCVGASLLSAVLLAAAWHVIRINRRDTWRTMTAQLRNDLRMWALRNPELFSALVFGEASGGLDAAAS